MSRLLISSEIHPVKKDFDEVISYINSKKIIEESQLKKQIGSIKVMHKSMYSLILWRFLLKKLPQHAKYFLDEIASDSLQILPQALMGYRKPVDLMIRGIIENILRYIYFFHHPIEFQISNTEVRWFIKIDDLFNYTKNHPVFVKVQKKFDAISRLRTLYDELSSFVHGRRVIHLEMRRALKDVTFNQSVFESQVKKMKYCAESTNFLLLNFHKDRVNRFQTEFKNIILGSIPLKARRVFWGIE